MITKVSDVRSELEALEDGVTLWPDPVRASAGTVIVTVLSELTLVYEF